MWRFETITSRLIFLHVVVIIIAAIFIPFVLFWFLDSDVDRIQQSALRVQAENVARNLKRSPDGTLSLELPDGLKHQYSEAYGRYSYVVLNGNGAVLFSSQAGRKPIVELKKQDTDVVFFESAGPQHNLTGATLRFELSGDVLYLQVAENLNHRDVLLDDVVRGFFERVALVIAPILLVLLVVDILIFRRTLKPIVEASDQARQISPARIGLRLTIKDIPGEIASLVSAVNQALDRLELGFRKQQEFAADAAHELRTPLAILRARLETLPEKNTRQILLRDIDNMTRTVAQLLDAAEIESMVISEGEVADIQAICREIAEFIVPLALSEGKSLALSGADTPVLVKGNPEMLRRAVRNIVENAIKHNPAGTAVDIFVDDKGVVSITDSGAGIAEKERERIFERRLKANTNKQSEDGAGLGLSIVKRIVEAHEGRISAGESAQGGARFTLSLPLAVASSSAG